MSNRTSQRALAEPDANRAMTPERTQAAIRSILRPAPERPRRGPSAETRAAVGARVERARAGERAQMRAEANPPAARAQTAGARRRPSGKGGRGANAARGSSHPLSAQERRAQMLERNAQLPKRPEHQELMANWKRMAEGGSLRTKPETATARAIREGQARSARYAELSPKEQRAALAQTRAVEGRATRARYSLTAREKDDYAFLKQNEERYQREVGEYTQLSHHAADPEDRRFGALMAHAAQSQLNLLEGIRTRLGEGKAAAKAAREARLAPLRAHLAGLKGAAGAEGVNAWLAQKYPQLGPTLQRSYGERPLSVSVARRIAASYATLEHEFPTAGARMAGLGINRSSDAPSALIHSTKRLSDGFRASVGRGQRAIGISPELGKRGALKSAPRGANGKPMSVEAMMRAAFAPAVERDLQALPHDSEGGKAYAKWAARYPGADFARAFTNIAYGRGGKGQRGEGRSPEVRALKRALSVAYPKANLTQKPIKPTT